MLIAVDGIILVMTVTKTIETKVKVRETDPTGSQILFFLVTYLLHKKHACWLAIGRKAHGKTLWWEFLPNAPHNGMHSEHT